MPLSHLDDQGRAIMVDVSSKAPSVRVASASARVRMMESTLEMLKSGTSPKGDVFAVARVAGIQAAKKTSDLIPLCHPIALSSVEVHFDTFDQGVTIQATARCTGPTGVEMEALSAASIAALTLYDMLKAVDRGMVIEAVRLESKEGGRSGPWRRATP